jgi:alpha-beta hydrolase superfamily lysophospholipase
MLRTRPLTHEDYLARLPAPWRDLAGVPPESTWWPWRDMTLHVARARRPAAVARLLILHGGGGHAGALWPFAALAAHAGFDVLVPDLPGYGRTSVPDPAAVRYVDWLDCVADLVRAETRADPRPLVVLGASMGGLLGYTAAGQAGGVTHVVATCLLDPADPVTWPALFRWGGARGLRLMRPLLRRVGPRLGRLRLPLRWLVPMHRIANDPSLARLCLQDSRGGGGRVSLGFLVSFLFSRLPVPPEARHAPPVTLVHPGDDRWTPPAMSLAFFRRIAAPKDYRELPGGGHFPVEAPAVEVLMAVMGDLLAARGLRLPDARRGACGPDTPGR